jgi:hypothetical protein
VEHGDRLSDVLHAADQRQVLGVQPTTQVLVERREPGEDGRAILQASLPPRSQWIGCLFFLWAPCEKRNPICDPQVRAPPRRPAACRRDVGPALISFSTFSRLLRYPSDAPLGDEA